MAAQSNKASALWGDTVMEGENRGVGGGRMKKVIQSVMLATMTIAVAGWWTAASGQSPALTVAEAQRLLDIRVSKSSFPACGVIVPLGVHQFIVTETYAGMSKHELAKTVTSLKEAGVIDIIDLPSMLGSVHFRVEINSQKEKDILRNVGGGPSTCLAGLLKSPRNEVLRVEQVKGGTTKWDGAIVYTRTTQRVLSPSFEAYLRARGEGWRIGDLRIRSLWKFDVFKNGWDSANVDDVGPLNGEFILNRVSDALRAD